MTFDELAQELSEAYTAGYTDRYKAMPEFGATYCDELLAIEREGRTIEEVVDAAQIGAPEHWAAEIRKGSPVLSIPNYEKRIRGLEQTVKELGERLETLATRDDISAVVKEVYAAEDHVMKQLEMVSGKVDGTTGDPQQRVVHRERDWKYD